MYVMYLHVVTVVILACYCTEFNNGIHKHMSEGAYKVYRVYPNNTEQLEFMKNVWKTASKFQLNFWKDPTRVGVASDVMAPPSMQPTFESLLVSNNIDYIITIEDVQKLIIERESINEHRFYKDLLADDPGDLRIRGQAFFDFRRYHSYEDMRVFMRQLEEQYPAIAKVYSLGFSHENRPIEMIKIGFPVSSTAKKAIWIDAGIHAREWASHSTAIYFIHQLVTKYEKDPFVTQYVNNLTWYITPVLNPDGYEYTRSSSEPEVRMWRKNRSPNQDRCPTGTNCCFGVDLNRNFDFHWGESGASDNPCEEIYQGSLAFSEPETRAVRDFISSHRNEIDAVITMHTYSQLWIHPFGHQRYIYPPDVSDLKSTADKATRALARLYGTKYKVGSGADTLYPASGGLDDWAKSKAGIKYVYLIELRPEEDVWDGFVLDSTQLIPTGRETWEGIKVVTNTVLEKNGFRLVKRARKRNSGSEEFIVRAVIRDDRRTRHRHRGLKHFEKKRQKSYFGERRLLRNPLPIMTESSSTFSTTAAVPSTNPITRFLNFPLFSTSTSSSSSSSSFVTSDSNLAPLSPAFEIPAHRNIVPLIEDLAPRPLSATDRPLTTWYPFIDKPNVISCSDFAGEERCVKWTTNRVGICQRITEYMSQNCAKTCGFC